MTRPEQDADHEALLALEVVDGHACEAPSLAEESPGLVAQLKNVQQIMTALEVLEAAPEPPSTNMAAWGPFMVKEQLGRGSFGIVYRGFDPGVSREVAIKLYAGSELPSEPRFMARVRHANVVTVFGAAVYDGRPGICMELVRGRTLAERVQVDGPLSAAEVARIGIEVCRALEAVHEAHLVHQDVKARNVMEQDDGRIVLMDFGTGVARSTGDVPARRAGTPLYMAPEVILGDVASAQSDIYSLGVLLHYLFSGMYPTPASSWHELRERLERGEAPTSDRVIERLRQVRPDLPHALSRCIAKALAPASERFATAADLRAALESVRRRGRDPRWIATAMSSRLLKSAALLTVLVAGIVWAARAPHRPAKAPSIAVLRRLTWDTGLTIDPTRSADGNLLAYASDRAGQENLDIWVQQIVGGVPLQLTADPADEMHPSFAPDGSQIAFRSERDGGGVYVVPTLGGHPRLLAAGGRVPRFSPDGRRIAYFGGPAGGSLFIAPVSGGSVREYTVKGLTAPIWSSDGRHLLLMAWGPTSQQDWWIVPVDGGAFVKTGALAALAKQGFEVVTAWPTPWTWTENRVLFHARRGDAINLWEVVLDPSTFSLLEPARRLTLSTEDQFQPSVADDGGMAFATRTETPYLWELALHTDRSDAVPRGVAPPRMLIPHYPGRGVHDLSADGRWMVYNSSLPGRAGLAVMDLRDGTEHALTASSLTLQERFPVISSDGTQTLYGAVDNGERTIRRVSVKGGIPETVCQDCGLPTDWSPDSRHALLLYGVPDRATLGLLDLSTRRHREILTHPESELYRGTFSPDGRWIAFHLATQSGPTREVIAPFRGPTPILEREWISVTDGNSWTDAPRWSPDGNTLYYISDADGYRCIWARRLDAGTKRPLGDPFAVHHVHARKHSITNLATTDVELSVAPGRIIYSMTAARGNVWLAEFQ